MLRTNKLILRTTPGNKDLLSLETTRVTVHLFEAEPSDLEQLAQAIDEVLGIIAAQTSPTASTTHTA